VVKGIGDRFQQETKYDRHMMGWSMDRIRRPDPYKEYPDADRTDLSHPEDICRGSLDGALRTRRSVRRFADQPLTREQISYLLWASTGIQRKEGGYEFRTAPSAGALYPIETYLAVNSVEGVKQGVHHYRVRQHQLELLVQGDWGKRMALAALGQRPCADCAVVFVWTAIFDRTKWKYGQRAYRYLYLEAGHIAQNLALASAALGLGSVQIGALFDDEVNDLLGVDGEDESVLYLSAVGHPLRLTSAHGRGLP